MKLGALEEGSEDAYAEYAIQRNQLELKLLAKRGLKVRRPQWDAPVAS